MSNLAPRLAQAVKLYCKANHRHRWWFVFAAILVALAMSAGVLFLQRTADNRVFFGAENPDFAAFQSFESIYGQNNDVLVALAPRTGDVFAPDALAALEALTGELKGAPYLTRLQSLLDLVRAAEMSGPAPDPERQSAADRRSTLRAALLSDPIAKGLFVSADGRVAGVSLNFELSSHSPAAIEEIVAHLRQAKEDIQQRFSNVDIYMTGNVMIMSTFAQAGDADLISLGPIMAVVIGALLLVISRSIVAVLISSSLALLATGAALGFAGWVGIILNAGSMPAILVLLPIALAYSIHILIKFLDDYRAGWSKREAIAHAVEFNLMPVSLISLTTAIGFFSLNTSEAQPFRDLGTIVGIGIIATYLLAFTLVPALLSVMPHKRPADVRYSARTLKRIGRFIVLHKRKFVLLSFLIIGGLSAGIPRIELNDNWVRYFDQRFEFRRDTEFVLGHLTGIDILEYSVPTLGETAVTEPAYLERLDRFASWLRAQPEVTHVTALTDFLKRTDRNIQGRAELVLDGMVARDRTASRVTVFARQGASNLTAQELRALDQRIVAWLASAGAPESMGKGTGLSLMFANMSERNIRSMLLGTFIAFLLISAILIVALRNPKAGLISLVPNIVPAIMGFGLWGYLVGEAGTAVSVVAAMTFGIVVDDTIHFLTRYLKGRRELGKNAEEAIQYAFASVGKAIFVTTVVLVCGFGVLALSGFKVSSSIGALTAIVLARAFFCDFVLLPGLLLLFDRGPKKRDAESHPTVQASRSWPALPALEKRVAAYYERVKDGHPVLGRDPLPDSIHLWSNDYLSLHEHPRIIGAQVEALQHGRTDAASFDAETDGRHPRRPIERMLAQFLRAPDAMLCQSGWFANVDLMQSLSDPETHVYPDLYAHASLWEGARLGGAIIHPFRHNAPESLEQMIRRYGPGIVVIDSIYSANGRMAPLSDIADIAERHECSLVVDESHAVGVYGPDGEGLVPSLGLANKVHYRTISLSKAFVTRAGLILGPSNTLDYVHERSVPARFSASIREHEVVRLAATLDVIRSERWRRGALRGNTEYLRSHLHNLGYDVDPSGSQVIALPAGTERNAIRMRRALEDRSIMGAVFCYPATPKSGALIRLSANCGLTDENLRRVVDVLREIRPQFAQAS